MVNYIYIVFCFFCGSVFAQNNLVNYKLKGNVKSIQTFSYSMIKRDSIYKRGGLVDIELFGRNKITKFDKKGHRIKEVHFNNRGKKTQQAVFLYDKKGVLNASIYGDFMKLFKYQNKNVIEEIWCHSKKCKTQYTYTYLGGRLMLRKHRTKDTIAGKRIYTYGNKTNKPISEVLIHFGRKSNWKKDFTYDEKDNLTSIIKYNHKKLIEENIRFTYDEQNRLIEKISFYRIFSPNHYGIVYSYNSHDDIFKEIHYQLDTRSNFLGNSFIRTYKYKYDGKGNWIQCIVYQNLIPKYIIERSISYYKN